MCFEPGAQAEIRRLRSPGCNAVLPDLLDPRGTRVARQPHAPASSSRRSSVASNPVIWPDRLRPSRSSAESAWAMTCCRPRTSAFCGSFRPLASSAFLARSLYACSTAHLRGQRRRRAARATPAPTSPSKARRRAVRSESGAARPSRPGSLARSAARYAVSREPRTSDAGISAGSAGGGIAVATRLRSNWLPPDSNPHFGNDIVEHPDQLGDFRGACSHGWQPAMRRGSGGPPPPLRPDAWIGGERDRRSARRSPDRSAPRNPVRRECRRNAWRERRQRIGRFAAQLTVLSGMLNNCSRGSGPSPSGTEKTTRPATRANSP